MGTHPLEPFRVGTYTDPQRGTGLTVILAPEGMLGVAEIRGRAPGTREMGLLRPESAPRLHALMITGGSAFGLDACEGVVRFLREIGAGHPTPYARIPLVAAAVIFDLNLGDARAYPAPDHAYHAAREAQPLAPPEGSVGAGTGATVGKWAGPEHMMKGGQGFSLIGGPGGGWMGILAVVNAVGDVLAEDGRVLAGARDPRGFLRERGYTRVHPRPTPINTTHLVAFGTVGLSRLQAGLLAHRLHLAMARVIRPLHTRWDGDITFVLTVRETPMDEETLETFSEVLLQAAEKAIRRAVKTAHGLHGVPALADLGREDASEHRP